MEDVTRQFRLLEENLVQTEIRQSADKLSSLLADDFLEIGQSGTVYSKQQVIEHLLYEKPSSIVISHFQAILLAPEVAQTIYCTSRQNPDNALIEYSRRSSIWVYMNNQWQVKFHQGTPVKEADIMEK